MNIVARFSERSDLIRALGRQRIVEGDQEIAKAMAESGTLRGFAAGETLIFQNAFDRSIFLLLSGETDITVNGCHFPYGRAAGEAVGEMSAINPELPRSATVNAVAPVAALELAHADLITIGERHPKLWFNMAVELSRKLEQRNRFVDGTNRVPHIFIISSKEALPIGEEIRAGLVRGGLDETLIWSDEEIFPPGAYPLENLKREVARADFGIALAHPDDIRRSRGRQAAVPRDNVVFELGWFMSVLDRHRTILLVPELEGVDLPSDFKGLTPLSYRMPADAASADRVLAPVILKLRKHVERWGVRSKLEPGS